MLQLLEGLTVDCSKPKDAEIKPEDKEKLPAPAGDSSPRIEDTGAEGEDIETRFNKFLKR
jgi:hypothetical protein